MSDNLLPLNDKKVFPKQKEEFTLGSHDKHAVLVHTGIINKKRETSNFVSNYGSEHS